MAKVDVQQFIIPAKDGFPLASTKFSSSQPNGNVIVIASGVGVPKYAYYKFARFLASEGYSVLTFDYRGIFKSQNSRFPTSAMKMEEWGTKDIEAVLQFARHELKAEKLYFIGHSGGGQLTALAPSSVHIDKIVFLSVTLGHWRYWPGLWKWGLWLFWYSMPLLTFKRTHFPARLLGFSSIDIPAGVARQWARWGRSPHYLFDYITPEQWKRYVGLDIPLLAISFDDDNRLGPKKAADKILERFKHAEITRWHIKPRDYDESSIGHFGFFDEKFKNTLWPEVLKWIETGSEQE